MRALTAIQTASADPGRSRAPVARDHADPTPGNQARLRKLAGDRSVPQAKRAVGAVDDTLEREAEQVLASDTHSTARRAPPLIQRYVGDCAARGARSGADTAPNSVAEALRLPGRPLDAATRAEFEPRFGRDFGEVRVHSDAQAAAAARSINAAAFAFGRHIVFGEAHSVTDRRLLAHELTHVVQQAAFHGHNVAGAPVLDAGHFSEQEARAGTAAPSPLAAPAIQRAPPDVVTSGQQLEIDLSNSSWRKTLDFEGGQTQIVYVLRDATTGELLKVGKTTVDDIAGRFGEYVAAGNKWSRKLAADVWTLRARSKKNVEVFEAQIRAGLEKSGARLPWDNTRVPEKGPRLGRPGQGIPDTKPKTETEFIDEVEQLRVKHAPPNVPKRRGMSSKEKAKLKAAEDKAAAEATAAADASAKAEQDSQPAATKASPEAEPTAGKAGTQAGGDSAPHPAEHAQGDQTPGKPATAEPKVETPPIGGAGATAERVGLEASRLRTAGRLLAKEAPALLLQAMLMALFPPEVHIHNENYAALSAQKIDPALQTALKEQAATLNKLAADDPAQSIWATVTVESAFSVDATSGGDAEVYLQDLRFIGMKITREYLLVEGKKFDVGKPGKASKTVTYSVPIFGAATHGSEEVIRDFRKVREGLTDSSYKRRLSAMLNMYKMAKANPFLTNQLIRDLQGMSNDDETTVQDLAAHMLSLLKPER
jgi:hypothetical protein